MHYHFSIHVVFILAVFSAPYSAAEPGSNPSELIHTDLAQQGKLLKDATTPDTNTVFGWGKTPEPLPVKTNLAFGLQMPISGKDISLLSGFGVHYHPVLQTPKMHTGLDLGAPRGTPVVAASDGLIVYAKRNGMYGLHIELRHSDKLSTTYSHLRRIEEDIMAGVRVKRGQALGQLGQTGFATIPHLHFEVRLQGSPIDPLSVPTKSRLPN